jgi:hypothetical protein
MGSYVTRGPYLLIVGNHDLSVARSPWSRLRKWCRCPYRSLTWTKPRSSI